MADRYEYAGVSEETKQFAKRELGENPDQVNAHIESLRKWVKSMPHLQCPTDADFLIKFLRAERFDHEKAQMLLDNFCTFRKSSKGCPHFLKLCDLDDPIVEKYLNMKFFVPLGKNNAGETVAIIRFNAWEPDTLSWCDLMCMFYMDMNIVIMDETVQIQGIKFIGDFENLSIKAMEAMCDPNDLKWSYTILQDSLPMTIKSQIFYNEPVLFDVIYNIVFFFMNDNMKSRAFHLSQDLKKAEEQIPGLVKILPKEYNGEGDTLDNIAGRWNKTFRDFYKTDHFFTKLSVDESRRPADACKYLPEFVEYKGETFKKK